MLPNAECLSDTGTLPDLANGGELGQHMSFTNVNNVKEAVKITQSTMGEDGEDDGDSLPFKVVHQMLMSYRHEVGPFSI